MSDLWNAVPLRETIYAVITTMPSEAAPEHVAAQVESQVRAWLDRHVVEPMYEYRAVSPVGTADPDETGPVRATAEDARDDLEYYFGLEPDDEQWIERSPVRTWERVQ